MKSSHFLAAVTLLFVGAEAFSATYAFRDKELYNTYGRDTPATVTVFTYPPQPNQPVYSWRTHEYSILFHAYDTYLWIEGSKGYDGDYVGTTDQNGILNIHVEAIPRDTSFCGRYTNERFSVGQNSQSETTPISFKIHQKRGPDYQDFGPFPPMFEECFLENM